MRSLDDQPRADAPAAVRLGGVDRLEAAASARHDDAAAPDDLARVEGDVPGAAAGPEQHAQILHPLAAKDAVALLLEALRPPVDLELDHLIPQRFVRARVRLE